MSSMLMDEDDAAFQADLARAIAASLEPDALGPYEPNTTNNEAQNWNALLAAGEAATWGGLGRGPGGGFGTGVVSTLPPTSGGGLSSPNLLVSDLEEDEDEEYQRQLAAAMEASLQSAQDERQRRALTTSEQLDELTDYDKNYASVGLGRGCGGGREYYIRSEGGEEMFPGGGVVDEARFVTDPMTRRTQRTHPPSSPAPSHHHQHQYRHARQQPPVWQQQPPQPQLQSQPQAVPSAAVPGAVGAVCCSSGLVLKPLAASRKGTAALHPLATSTPAVLTRTVTTAMVRPSQSDMDNTTRLVAATGILPAAPSVSPAATAAAATLQTYVESRQAAAAGAGPVVAQVWRDGVAAGGAEVHMDVPPGRAHSLPAESPQCDTTCTSMAATDSSRASSEGEMPLPRSVSSEAGVPEPTGHNYRLLHTVPSGACSGAVLGEQLVLSSSPVKHARPASLAGAGESVQPLTKRSRPESSNSNDSAASGGGGGSGLGPLGSALGIAAGARELPSGVRGGRMGSPEDSGVLPPAGGGRGANGGKGGMGGMETGSEMERFWEDGGAELPAVSHSPPERPASASSCCATVIHDDVVPMARGDVMMGDLPTNMMTAANVGSSCGPRGSGGVLGSGGFTLDLSAVATAAPIPATSKTGSISDGMSQFLVVPASGANGPQHPAAAVHALVGQGVRNAPAWALHGSLHAGVAASAPDDLQTWQQDAGRMLRRISADGESGGDDDVTLLSCRETMLPLTYERPHWELRAGGRQELSGGACGGSGGINLVAAPAAATAHVARATRGSAAPMTGGDGRGGGSTSRRGDAPSDIASWKHTPFVVAAARAPILSESPSSQRPTAPVAIAAAGAGGGGPNPTPVNMSPLRQSNEQHLPQQSTRGAEPSVNAKMVSQSAAGCTKALPGHPSRQATVCENRYPSLPPQQHQYDDPQWTHPSGPPRWRYSGSDRRMLRHQQVWWWCGPGQVQLGRITSIDYRSEPPLYTVRLDPDHMGKEGEKVVATADCLLPYVPHGDWLMCRLPPPPLALSFVRRVTVEEEEACRQSNNRGCMEEVVAPGRGVVVGLGHGAAAEGWTRQGPSVAVLPIAAPGELEDEYNQAPCVWMAGRMQHCIFDGPVPRVAVLLGGSKDLPYELPYENVVPVSDAAESSGCGGNLSTGVGGSGGRQKVETPGGGASGPGGDNVGGHTAVNTCLEIVLA